MNQNLASTAHDLTLGFTDNPAGQVIQRTVSNDAYAYTSSAQTKSYVPNGLNRYTSVGGVSYGYDLRGNLTSDGSRSFTYDLENHLLSVTGSGVTPVTLTYDTMGRLLSSTSGGVTTRYLYDGDRLVAEYQGSTLVRRYAHGAGVDEPLVWYEGATLTNRRWLHADHQGSVVATSDGAGVGTVYAYSAYGEPANNNWSGSRFRYTGQIMLPEAKLYHYKARVYDPVLGRFLQTDPVGYKDDFNLYAYVGNDPLNRVDPTGTYSCGASLSAGQCETFTKAQDAAKQQLTSAVGTLSGIQSKVNSGEKLSGAQQKVADGVSKVLGKGAGTDAKVLGTLIDAGNKMLGKLNSNMPAEFGGNYGGRLAEAPGNQLTLYSGFFRQTPTGQAQTTAHESHHHALGGLDIELRYGKESISPYGYPAAVRRAEILSNPTRSMRIPDPTTYALGFEDETLP